MGGQGHDKSLGDVLETATISRGFFSFIVIFPYIKQLGYFPICLFVIILSKTAYRVAS